MTIFSVALDGNREPDLVHATGCKQPTSRLCYVCYADKVIQFNRSQPPPDVQREEWMISFIQDSYSGGEVGYR
jgi:hypothetical protein